MNDIPQVTNEQELEEILTRPRPALVDFIQTVQSPLVILGAGGKMGPSLAVLARRAAQAAGKELEIVAASRFSDQDACRRLEERGVRTLRLDLLERKSYEALPDSENIVYLVGLKFGTALKPSLTWATNTLAPAYTCERYAGAKIAALSSGNVYPLTPVNGRGSRENDPLTPLGEYANSCVARERIFDYFSTRNGSQAVLIRLSYAVDLRYGVLLDIARRVHHGEPVDVTMGFLNCIWQGDANEMILRALALARSPATPINLTGVEPVSVRQAALEFARWLDKKVIFQGREADTALLSNTSRLNQALGTPPTPLEWMIRWTADWVRSGGRNYDKPTHYQEREGKY
jgi:hypothetical protein